MVSLLWSFGSKNWGSEAGCLCVTGDTNILHQLAVTLEWLLCYTCWQTHSRDDARENDESRVTEKVTKVVARRQSVNISLSLEYNKVNKTLEDLCPHIYVKIVFCSSVFFYATVVEFAVGVVERGLTGSANSVSDFSPPQYCLWLLWAFYWEPEPEHIPPSMEKIKIDCSFDFTVQGYS